MQLDASIHPNSLQEVPRMAEVAEQVGIHTLWTSETQHDPFLPLGILTQHSTHLKMGTAVAIGFARSPGVLAYTSWDLARASRGRFILGLGTQVRSHIQRRFGMEWPESPTGKLRELLLAIRAYWSCWQDGEPLQFRGKYYRLSLMTPFFNPGAIDHPEIPIFIAGVNRYMCQLAGEVADGFHAHPYHSESYLREVVVPSIKTGQEKANRPAGSTQLSVTVFVVLDEFQSEFTRSQIAFYASTPSYRAVMEHHGWEETADRLREMVREGAWVEMPKLIDDEMLKTFAVVCDPDRLATALKDRYMGLADRLTIYQPFVPDEKNAFWENLTSELGAVS
jgi:probable F420-dependent oxidoreductase